MFKKESLNDDYMLLPDSAGIYIFKDGNGVVLYIGKAKSLKKRVLSYSRPNSNDWKLETMIDLAEHIEFRRTKNQVEAMILEAQLIQNHQPKFNIMLKAGRPFLYFVFTQGNPPELVLTRNNLKNEFAIGPFIHRSQARKIFDTLLDNFKLRICHKKISNGCMYFHIGKCSGFCRDDFDLPAYLIRLERVKKLLIEGPESIVAQLEAQIEESDQNLNFERSKILSSQLDQIKQSSLILETGISKNRTFAINDDEKHVWIWKSENNFLQMFVAKSGIVKKKELWLVLPEQNFDPNEYLRRYYSEFACPNSIFTNFEIDEKDSLALFLSKWHGKSGKVAIFDRITEQTTPEFVSLCLAIVRVEVENFAKIPTKLAAVVGSKKPIYSIDCFDISHHQGHFVVGSCVRFVSGRPDKANFRHFNIKTVVGQDDYACLREIVSRRYKNGTADLPDLVLIDGGKGQKSAVADLVGQRPLAALAKQEEILFCAKNQISGIKLDSKKPHHAILIAIRDYAHSFAINFHRKISKITE